MIVSTLLLAGGITLLASVPSAPIWIGVTLVVVGGLGLLGTACNIAVGILGGRKMLAKF